MKATLLAASCLLLLCYQPELTPAGRSTAVRETVEWILGKFGKQVAEEGVDVLASKINALALRHGDEVLQAIKKAGPQALPLIEKAGEHASVAVKLLAKHGDEAAWLLSRPQSLKVIAQHGDEAAEALLKHKGIANAIIDAHGQGAARALVALDPQNARRLATMIEKGELATIGRTPQLLHVLERFGDRAMDFVWRHKAALTLAAVLAAFLADPEPFLNGVRGISEILGDAAVRPLAEVPGKVAQEAARNTNWTLLVLVSMTLLSVLLLIRSWRKRHRRR